MSVISDLGTGSSQNKIEYLARKIDEMSAGNAPASVNLLANPRFGGNFDRTRLDNRLNTPLGTAFDLFAMNTNGRFGQAIGQGWAIEASNSGNEVRINHSSFEYEQMQARPHGVAGMLRVLSSDFTLYQVLNLPMTENRVLQGRFFASLPKGAEVEVGMMFLGLGDDGKLSKLGTYAVKHHIASAEMHQGEYFETGELTSQMSHDAGLWAFYMKVSNGVFNYVLTAELVEKQQGDAFPSNVIDVPRDGDYFGYMTLTEYEEIGNNRLRWSHRHFPCVYAPEHHKTVSHDASIRAAYNSGKVIEFGADYVIVEYSAAQYADMFSSSMHSGKALQIQYSAMPHGLGIYGAQEVDG